jgi:transcriptional regulator with XRE-family HTH domain
MNGAELGRRFRELRRAGKVKAKDIAAHAGISGSYLGMIERGEREASLETAGLIAQAMGYEMMVRLIPRSGLWRDVKLRSADADTAEALSQLSAADRSLIARLVAILPHINPQVRAFLAGQIELLEQRHLAERRSASQ